MKILVLTDLYWNSSAKKISKEDIKDVTIGGPPAYSERYRSLQAYWHIIIKEKPRLVLLGGDLTGDGSCGHGFQNAFFYLLCLLELSKTSTFFIRGDNDLAGNYAQVIDNISIFSYIKEISNTVVEFENLKILGIPFQSTANKKSLHKLLLEKIPEVDIVLCHSELKRRTTLFELDARIIITGHFDNKLCSIQDKLFLSFSNDSNIINYGTLTYSKKKTVVDYYFHNQQKKSQLHIKEQVDKLLDKESSGVIHLDGLPMNISEFENLRLPNSDYEKTKNALALAVKYLRGKNYSMAIEQLLTASSKSDYIKLNDTRKSHITAKHKLSKSMILDYLGNKVRKYLV